MDALFFLIFFLSKPMMSTIASLTFQQLLYFSSRVEFSAASPSNSSSSISLCELERSILAMAAKLRSLRVHARYSQMCKRYRP